MQPKTQVKIVGANGQLSLGKEFAGQMVLIDQIDASSWFIKAGKFIPHSEHWLYQNGNEEKLDRALEWAEKNEPKDNFKMLIQRMENGKDKN